jgi:hypothetical protein
MLRPGIAAKLLPDLEREALLIWSSLQRCDRATRSLEG